MSRGIGATIDLSALKHNLSRVRQTAPTSRVMAAIKANGYGHGLVRVAQALGESDGFAVACLDEALELRAAGIDRPILLLEGPFEAAELPVIEQQRLQIVVHNLSQVEMLEQARVSSPIPVWVKVDTGMHRIGLPPPELPKALRRLRQSESVAENMVIMTHLACADERDNSFTDQQIAQFDQTTSGLDSQLSIANSGAILGWPGSHRDWVRPGIMLYGASPFNGNSGVDQNLRPVMTFGTKLIAINRFKAGDSVGYGATWRCPEAMPVGVAAIGYGDGYPRHAPSGTPMLVNGQRVPIIGRVSMDMITLDLRDQPAAKIGDPVVAWGAGLPVEEIAAAAGTISYELLCGITSRVPVMELTG